MAFPEKIYNRSPLLLQNILMSIYGIKLYHERYSGRHRKYTKELINSQWLKIEEIEKNQISAAKSLFLHAYNNVKYYKDLFDCCGFIPGDFRSLNELKKIPTLEKEILRTSGDRIISKNISKHKMVCLNTSGTSGTTLKIMVDFESRRKSYAFYKRFHNWFGIKNGKHNITFGGRVLIPPRQQSKIFWRYNAMMDNYLFSSYHLSDENLKFYYNKIRKIKPLWIESYPSAVYTLAKYMYDRNLKGIKPKVVITSAETLLEYQREIIENVFECPVRDQYGCTEQAVFISQCEYGSYHVNPEYGIVEILKENGMEAEDGEIGNVVCTSFMNRATPLIRYNLGDTVVKSDKSCNCKRNFARIEKIYGRKDDYVITPDRRKVGRLDPIYKGLTSIKEAQIVQTQFDEIIVKLVVGKKFTKENGAVLRSELRKRVGSQIRIKLAFVDKIPKTEAGKFRAVISKIEKY